MSAYEQSHGREPDAPTPLDVAGHFRALRSVFLPAVIIALLAATAVFALRASSPSRWEATVTTRVDGAAGGGDPSTAAALLDAPYLALAADIGVLQDIVTKAGVDWDGAQAKSRIAVAGGSTPGLLVVTVQGDRAAQAAAVAKQAVLTLDSVARTRQAVSLSAQVQQAQAAADAINSQRQALAPLLPAPAGLDSKYQLLLDQKAQLQATGLARLSALADPVISAGPVTPKPWRDAALMFLVALVAVSESWVLLRGRVGTSTTPAWAGRIARKNHAVFVNCVSGGSVTSLRVETLVLRELSSSSNVLVLACPPAQTPVLEPGLLHNLDRRPMHEHGTGNSELVELPADQPWWRRGDIASFGLGIVVVVRGCRQRSLVSGVFAALADAGIPAALMLIAESDVRLPLQTPSIVNEEQVQGVL